MRHVFATGAQLLALTSLLACERPCNAPGLTNDPSDTDGAYPVACADCGSGERPDYCGEWRGLVCYPARFTNSTQFNDIATRFGPAPIVFFSHGGGNGQPRQYAGFEYMQRTLAKWGIATASVAVGAAGPTSALLDTIEHFRRLDQGPGVFTTRLDFRRVGLAGHSMGGAAVVALPERIRAHAFGASARRPLLQGVYVRAVIAMNADRPLPANVRDYALLVLQSSSDPSGDHNNNPYDRVAQAATLFDLAAAPKGYKALVYVRNGVHEYFDATYPYVHAPPVLSAMQHQRVLEVYGTAFFRDILLGHTNERGVLDRGLDPVAGGHSIADVGRAFSPLTNEPIDDFDDTDLTHNFQLGAITTTDVIPTFGNDSASDGVHGASTILILQRSGTGTEAFYRSALTTPVDIAGKEFWVRAAAVPGEPATATSFSFGVEDAAGNRRWVSESLAPPVATTTFLTTFRFKDTCLLAGDTRFEAHAVLLRPNESGAPVAFDDLEIYEPMTTPPPEECSSGGEYRCCEYQRSTSPPLTRDGIQLCEGRYWQPCQDCPFGRRSCSSCDHL